jgi:hypothetical protein
VSEANAFEQLYLKERKKARIFTLTSAALAILLIGSVLMSMNRQPATSTGGPSGEGGMRFQGGEGPPGGGGMRFRGPGGGGGQGGIQMRGQITDFLNEDGTVNKGRVSELLGRVPPEYKGQLVERFGQQIGDAQGSGEITGSQADELRKAFGI